MLIDPLDSLEYFEAEAVVTPTWYWEETSNRIRNEELAEAVRKYVDVGIDKVRILVIGADPTISKLIWDLGLERGGMIVLASNDFVESNNDFARL